MSANSELVSKSKIVSIDEIEMQDNSKDKRKDKEEEEDENKNILIIRQKKQQVLILFFGNLASMIFLSFFNFAVFLSEDSVFIAVVLGLIFILSTWMCIVDSCLLSVTIKDMCALYFLVDSICVALLTCMVGTIGMIILLNFSETYIPPLFSLLNVSFFLFAGNQRVIIANAKYQRWQTLSLKIAIIIGLLGYLALAAYMMITNFKTIPLKEDNLDAFQNFFFLYIFGLFTLHMEIFSKISDLDGTGNNQYHYSIADEDEYVKINLTRSKKEETHDQKINESSQPGKKGVEIQFLENENY